MDGGEAMTVGRCGCRPVWLSAGAVLGRCEGVIRVADDGRFALSYAAYVRLPDRDHIAAVRKLRAALKEKVWASPITGRTRTGRRSPCTPGVPQ
jgi:hypothetical protein